VVVVPGDEHGGSSCADIEKQFKECRQFYGLGFLDGNI